MRCGEVETVYDEAVMPGLLSHRPDSATRRSPFRPGSGILPPYLAGRVSEQSLIQDFLEDLAQRAAPPSDIVLYGPRGNGKTALLLWARNQARSLGIDAVRFSGKVVPTAESLARRISSEPRLLRWLGGLSLSRVGGGRTLKDPERQVAAVLARRARKRPTLLAVDEAHRLGTTPGEVLLNEVQGMRGAEAPVLLILAGTPDLPRHLSTMGASFWDRGEQLPLGRLEPDAAADAVRVPFEEHGRSIEEEALEQVVRESHGYPFFLQLWGDLLWKDCSDPEVPSSLVDIDCARPWFERRRDIYYDRRLDELDSLALVSVAAEVAAEFSDAEPVRRERVQTAIRSALEREGGGKGPAPSAIIEADRVLRHRGYIWPVVQQSNAYYQPGIPSLMRYVTRNQSDWEAGGEAS